MTIARMVEIARKHGYDATVGCGEGGTIAFIRVPYTFRHIDHVENGEEEFQFTQKELDANFAWVVQCFWFCMGY